MLWAMLLAMAMCFAPTALASEDGEESEEIEESEGSDESRPTIASDRARVVILRDGALRVPRPTGWVIADDREGALVTFRATTDRNAQIDVRWSENIPQARWDRFIRSFDADLQARGFRVFQGRAQVIHGGRTGYRQEYELEVGGEGYRLVVWHTHEGSEAWIFTAFFRTSRRDSHGETFVELLRSMEWR